MSAGSNDTSGGHAALCGCAMCQSGAGAAGSATTAQSVAGSVILTTFDPFAPTYFVQSLLAPIN